MPDQKHARSLDPFRNASSRILRRAAQRSPRSPDEALWGVALGPFGIRPTRREPLSLAKIPSHTRAPRGEGGPPHKTKTTSKLIQKTHNSSKQTTSNKQDRTNKQTKNEITKETTKQTDPASQSLSLGLPCGWQWAAPTPPKNQGVRFRNQNI